MEKSEIAKAVGHIPSGLFVICSHDKDLKQKDGYLASWVQQVSFSPLVVSLAINPGRPGYEHIMSGKIFSINIVSESEMGYLKYFWKGYAPEENPFKEIGHKESQSGAIHLDGAKSVIECQLISKAKPGDHELIFAEVKASYILNEEAKPKVHIRKNGLDY